MNQSTTQNNQIAKNAEHERVVAATVKEERRRAALELTILGQESGFYRKEQQQKNESYIVWLPNKASRVIFEQDFARKNFDSNMKKMIGDQIFGPKNEGNVGLIGSYY